MKIFKLATKLKTKLAQNLINENRELIKNQLINLINTKYNTIKKPSKLVVKLMPLGDQNTIVIEFWYGAKPITSQMSDKALEIENAFINLLKADKNINLIFNKTFKPESFGQPIEINGSLLKTNAVLPTETRKVRQEI